MRSRIRSNKNTASRRSGQRRSVVIPTLCALLMGGAVLSTVMLGESLGRVTPKQTDVIFLIRLPSPKAKTPPLFLPKGRSAPMKTETLRIMPAAPSLKPCRRQ